MILKTITIMLYVIYIYIKIFLYKFVTVLNCQECRGMNTCIIRFTLQTPPCPHAMGKRRPCTELELWRQSCYVKDGNLSPFLRLSFSLILLLFQPPTMGKRRPCQGAENMSTGDRLVTLNMGNKFSFSAFLCPPFFLCLSFYLIL